MELPNLKVKNFKSKPKSYNSSQKSSPNRMNSFSLQASIEILEGMDLIKYSKLKGETLNAQLSKEISRLEKDLDSSEINMYGATTNCDQEFRVYKIFLERLTSLTSKKDKRLSAVLLRGIAGCEKAFKKLNTQIRAEIPGHYSRKQAANTEISTQTIFHENLEVDPKSHMNHELEKNILSLPESMDKIKVSRITTQLSDLYDSLSTLCMEIPSPSESPEPMLPRFIESDKTINLKLTVIRKNINRILQGVSEVKKLGIPKECQTDFEFRRNTIIALEDMNEEKELDLFKMRSRFQILSREKALVDERLMRLNNVIEEYERKYAPFEIELARCKQDNATLVERVQHFERKFETADDNYDKSQERVYKMRKMIDGLKQMLKRKQAQLQEALDHLYNTQVIWRIAEAKLKKVEKSWKKNTGTPFHYKDINIDEITHKFALKKIEIPSFDEEMKTLEGAGYSDQFDLAVALYSDTQDEIPEQVFVSGNAEKRKKKYLKGSNVRKGSEYLKRPSVGRNVLNQNENQLEVKKETRRKSILEEDSSDEDLGENPKSNSAQSSRKSITLNIPVKPNNVDASKNYLQISDKKSLKNPPSRPITPMKNNKAGVKGSVKKYENTATEIGSEKKSMQSKISTNTNKRNQNTVTSTGSSHDQEKLSLSKHNPINLDSKHRKSISHVETSYEPETVSAHHYKLEKPEKTDLQGNKVVEKLSYQIKTRKSKDNENKISPESENYELQANEHEKIGNGSYKVSKAHTQSHFLQSVKEGNNLKEPQNEHGEYDEHGEKLAEEIKMKFTYDLRPQIDENLDADTLYNENPHSRHRSPSHAVLGTVGENDFLKPQNKSKACLSALSNQSSLSSLFGEDIYTRRRLSQTLNNNEQVKEVEDFQTSIEESKTLLSSMLTNEQRQIFEEIKAKEEEFRIMKSLSCSKATQCMLLLTANFDDKLERIRRKEKYRKLLGKVFEFPAEIDMLTPQLRRELAISLKGHKNSKCSENCEHLRRALQVKFKSRGIPYPIKTIKM